jgi:hypothetical protein
MLTKADEENYGSELLDMSRRAAIEAVGPELQRLHAENQSLRSMAQRCSMNAITNPDGGTVTLRGHTIEIGSEIGASFVLDICRHVEDLISSEALRTKYGLLDDDAYTALGNNEPLQRAIATAKERRIRDGTAQREKASLRWNSAIDVVNAIVQDPTASAKHRLDGARELRACAQAGSEADKPAGDKELYVINIRFGGNTIHKELELTPIAPEREEKEKEPPPLKLIEPARDEEDGYEWEYEPI